MLRPSAIILINADLTVSVKTAIINQLFIDEAMDGYVFDDRVAVDSSYPTTIRQLNMRLMVIRPFNEDFDRSAYDVVVFAAHGMISIEKNKFGPPMQIQEISRVTWPKLMVYQTNL